VSSCFDFIMFYNLHHCPGHVIPVYCVITRLPQAAGCFASNSLSLNSRNRLCTQVETFFTSNHDWTSYNLDSEFCGKNRNGCILAASPVLHESSITLISNVPPYLACGSQIERFNYGHFFCCDYGIRA
jgi:hypothetical protein